MNLDSDWETRACRCGTKLCRKWMTLATRLKELTRRVFVGVQGVSYSRCDFRVDARGGLWFLEINTNCGIFYPPGLEGSADMILKHDPMGHRGFLEHILRGAIIRRQRQSM